jgi:hypothetical protein
MLDQLIQNLVHLHVTNYNFMAQCLSWKVVTCSVDPNFITAENSLEFSQNSAIVHRPDIHNITIFTINFSMSPVRCHSFSSFFLLSPSSNYPNNILCTVKKTGKVIPVTDLGDS